MYSVVLKPSVLICAPVLLALFSGPSASFDLFGRKLFDRSDDVVTAEDALPYQATLHIEGGDDALRNKLKNGSLLMLRQSEPPSGTVGLVARARQDRRNLVGLLYQEGYYAGVVDIRIGERQLGDISVTQSIDPPAVVSIEIAPGELFRFGEIRISGADSVDIQSKAIENGLVAGGIARSEAVLNTESAILKTLENRGHPFPRTVGRDITADHRRNVLDVSITIASGPTARFGTVTVEGAQRLDSDHIAMIADIPTGASYSAEVLRHAKSRLAKIEALASVSLRPLEPVGPGGDVPIVIQISERKTRVIGAGASWSSTDGIKANVYWKHRNLFGHGELFRIDVGIGQLDESSEFDHIDANFGLLFSRPGFFGPATRFDAAFKVLQESPEAYRRRAVLGQSGIAYQHSPELELTSAIAAEYSDIDDALGSNRYALISAPLTANYDSRDNRLNPAEGIHAMALFEPTLDALSGSTFVKLDSSVASYYAFDRSKKLILAGRIAAGIIAAPDNFVIPANRAFLAGGGGSVRGYAYKNIGAARLNGEAVAGRSRLEGSAEARVQITDTIGAAIFADAAFVGADPDFTDIGDFKVGVGGGLRYFTPVGPIRLDIAVPLAPENGDPDFAFYLGIGQAF